MTGIWDQGQVTEYTREQPRVHALETPSFSEQFSDQLSDRLAKKKPVNLPVTIDPNTVLTQWHAGQLNSLVTHFFLDDVVMNHPLLDDLITALSLTSQLTSDVTTSLMRVHEAMNPLWEGSRIPARALMNMALAMVQRVFNASEMTLPDIHAYEARTIYNESSFGLVWPSDTGWHHMAMGESGIQPWAMDDFYSVELSGRDPMVMSPNGERVHQSLAVIDMNHSRVIGVVDALFETGFDGESAMSIMDRIHMFMQGFDYRPDVTHEWQDLTTIFKKNGGDCEDLAHLEASLLLRAFTDAGMSDMAASIELIAGMAGHGDTQVGHTVIQLNIMGVSYILDSTLPDGPIQRHIYESMIGFMPKVTYGLNATAATLAMAHGINTQGIGDIIDTNYTLTDLETDFLNQLGTLTNLENHLSLTDYKGHAVDYYNAVTDQPTNSGFWNVTSPDSGQDIAAQRLANPSTPSVDSVAIQEPLLVGDNSQYFDVKEGVSRLIEVPMHRLQEMSENLTSQRLNKYVGQLSNGYFVYDYSRVMADYTRVLDSIQLANCYLTAMMTYANSFNWIGSQLADDNEPNSNIKDRQRFLKSVQTSLLKMVDEVEYFIPLFTETYDDLNQAIYSGYKNEVAMEFQSAWSGTLDVFGLGEETIRRNQMMEKVEAEYWHVMAQNRDKIMQSTVSMPNSRALVDAVSYLDPMSNLTQNTVGGPGSYATLQRAMEQSIETDTRQAITVDINGMASTKYMDPVPYYFPYYFNELTYYNSPTGDEGPEIINKSDNDQLFYRFIDKSLGHVYNRLGLESMVSSGGFYTLPDWVTSLGMSNSSVSKADYKGSCLYQYFYAKAGPYHARFENEVYRDTALYGNDGTYENNVTAKGWSEYFNARVQYGTTKHRIHPYDFMDIFCLDESGNFTVTDRDKSKEVWDLLKGGDWIDSAGNATKKLMDALYSEGNFDSLKATIGPNKQNEVLQRLYTICSLDTYQHDQTMYTTASRPKLYMGATDSLKNNGYVPIYDGDYQFLNDEMNNGMDDAMKIKMKSMSKTVSESANAQSQANSRPDFTGFYVTRWDTVANVNVTLSGDEYTAQEVVTYLYNQTGDKFYSDLFVSASDQLAYYTQYQAYVAEDDFSDEETSYKNYNDPFTQDNDAAASIKKVDSLVGQMVHFVTNDIDSSQLVIAPPTVIVENNTNGGASTASVIPSSSPLYSYDYGAMTKLPFDKRIVTKATESIFQDQGQGPQILGEIQYVNKNDVNIDLTLPENQDKIGTYSGLFSDQMDDTLLRYRYTNSLEKPLTPVHSFNDESVVYDRDAIFGFIDSMAKTDADADVFLEGLAAARFIQPVFQRIQDSDSVRLSSVGFYKLMGYTIKADFFEADDGALAAAFSDDTTTAAMVQNAKILRSGVLADLGNKWRDSSKSNVADFFSEDKGPNHNLPPQLLRYVGEKVGDSIHGMDDAMPFMSYDWHALKAAHNGMMSMQNRIRLFYFITQAQVTSLQVIAKQLDNVAFMGTSAIEADLQILEKRAAKQTELLAQINAKTAQFVEINNQYYRQKLNTIKASDVGIRVAKGVKLYGDLAAAGTYLVGQGLYAAAAIAGGPTNPVGASLLVSAETTVKVAAGMQIAAMVGEVTEKSIRLAHEYGLPQKMDADLFLYNSTQTPDDAQTIFKQMTGYKSPVEFSNGGAWEPNFQVDGEKNITDLKGVYHAYSPLYTDSNGQGNGYLYVSEQWGQDVWSSPSDTVANKQGDCEDYAVLAASIATTLGIHASELRIVNGVLNYGGDVPRSHTVLMRDTSGRDTDNKFSTTSDDNGRHQFSNGENIQVIDLTAPLNDDEFYTLDEYQLKYGVFQPMYSYDKPGSTQANLRYGFKDYEVMGYGPSASIFPDPLTPKGPKDLGPYADGQGYSYELDQNSGRRSVLRIYDESNTLVDTRSLPLKIEYGQRTYTTTNPTGDSVTLTLFGNYDDTSSLNVTDAGEVKESVKDKLAEENDLLIFDESDIDLSGALGDYVATDVSQPYESRAVIGRATGHNTGGGILGQDIVLPQMQAIITMEMEEHALLNEMFKLSLKPLDMSENNNEFSVYDWPAFQVLQRRLFVVQMKMKKMFLVMKLRAEFFSLIGARMGDTEQRQVGSSMDRVFSSHFAQMTHSVEALQTLMTSMQSIRQANYDVDAKREQAAWELAFRVPVNAMLSLVALIPQQGPLIKASVDALVGVLEKTIVFFGSQHNAIYLKSVDEVRESTQLIGSNSGLDEINDLYHLDDSSTYGDWQNRLHASVGKIPVSGDNLDDPSSWGSQQQDIYNTGGATLSLDDVVSHYWDAHGYKTPTMESIYSGAELAPDTGKTLATESLEDYVMKRLSSRYFPDTGDSLIFLDSVVYAMSGSKLATDIDFFNWIQGRLTAEMMHQIRFSMIMASYRSISANLGYTTTGGNDAMQLSTALTGDIGTHYFQLHTTLSVWEQAQIEINNRRFTKYKELDQIILEGIISVGTLALSAISGGLAGKMASTGATIGQTIARVALQIFSGVTLVALEMVTQLTELIYNAVDAAEENMVKQRLDKRAAETENPETLSQGEDETNLEFAERKLKAERDAVNSETLETAGNTTTGFASTYVNQQTKVQLKRQVQELFKMMESHQEVSESRADFIRQLASNMGHTSAQVNIGGALGRVQGLAKQATDKALDVKFSLLAAAAQRENELHSAQKGMIMAASQLVFGVFMKAAFRGAKKNAQNLGVGSKNRQKGFSKFTLDLLESSLTNMLSNVVTLGMTIDGTDRMENNRDDKNSDNHLAAKKTMGAVADGASSARGQSLSGLEQRLLNAQFNMGATQEMLQLNQAITEALTQMGQNWAGLIAQLMKQLAKKQNNDMKRNTVRLRRNAKDPKASLQGIKAHVNRLKNNNSAGINLNDLAETSMDQFNTLDKQDKTELEQAREDAIAMALVAEASQGDTAFQTTGDSNNPFMSFLFGNGEDQGADVVAKVLSEMSTQEQSAGIKKGDNVMTSDRILQKMMRGNASSQELAAQVMSRLSGSPTANMENILDAFTSNGTVDGASVVGFLNQLKNPEMVREMIDQGAISSATKDRMAALFTTPDLAQSVGKLRAAGLTTDAARLKNVLMNPHTGLSRQVNMLRSNQISDPDGTIAESLVALYSEGTDKEFSRFRQNPDSQKVRSRFSALNKTEAKGIQSTLKNIMNTEGEEVVKNAMKRQLAGASPSKQHEIRGLASELGLMLPDNASEQTFDGMANTKNKEARLKELFRVSGSGGEDASKNASDNATLNSEPDNSLDGSMNEGKGGKNVDAALSLHNNQIKTVDDVIDTTKKTVQNTIDAGVNSFTGFFGMNNPTSNSNIQAPVDIESLQDDPPKNQNEDSPLKSSLDDDNDREKLALIMSIVADHAGLKTKDGTSFGSMEENNNSVLTLSKPDKVIKDILDAINDTTNSAEVTGYVKDVFTSMGLTVGDQGTIVALTTNPKELMSVISAHRTNIINFILPTKSGAHAVTDAQGNSRPQESEFIRRFMQTVLRASGGDMALPIHKGKIDPTANTNIAGDPGTKIPITGLTQPISGADKNNINEKTPITTQQNGENPNVQTQNNQNDQGISTSQQSIAMRQAKLDENQTEINKLEKEQKEKEGELQELKDDLETATTSLDDAKGELAKAEATLAGLTETNKGLLPEDQVTALNTELDSLNQTISQHQELLNGVPNDMNLDGPSNVSQIKAPIDVESPQKALTGNIKEWKTKKETLETKLSNHNKAQQKKAAAQSQVGDFKTAVNLKQEAIKLLKNKIQATTSAIEELTIQHTKLTSQNILHTAIINADQQPASLTDKQQKMMALVGRMNEMTNNGTIPLDDSSDESEFNNWMADWTALIKEDPSAIHVLSLIDDAIDNNNINNKTISKKIKEALQR